MRDFLQAASNTAADTVAAPVDLIAFLLRKAGVPVPQNAVGGTQWMTERGLRRDVQQSPASLAGETVGLLSPVVAAAKAPQIAKGLLQVEANAAAPRTLRPEAGAIVWHGSPHKFDRFDASKIGTGEGAQAYGHGLYLAESPGVARQYAENVKDMGAVQRINAELSQLSKIMASDEIPGAYRKYRTDAGREAAKRYDELMTSRESVRQAPGQMYKVDLPDEKIARMLDWDKPLSQQAELAERVKPLLREVIDAKPYSGGWGSLEPNPADLRELFTKQGTPLGLYSEADAQALNVPGSVVVRALGKGDKESWKASEALRKQGIPGIRYLDGGSRGAGAGTSNFVVFPGEEQFLRILERNGGLLGP